MEVQSSEGSTGAGDLRPWLTHMAGTSERVGGGPQPFPPGPLLRAA